MGNQSYSPMKESFPVEFVGGSRDGATIEAENAPEVVLVKAAGNMNEVYVKQNQAPPFVYVQVGYAENESLR